MKKYIVTGASSGIGKAVCEQLLARGYGVIGIARDFTQSHLVHEHFFSYALDLSDLDRLPEVIHAVFKAHPDTCGLVSNAGSGRFGHLEEFSPAHIQAMVQLNLTHHVILARACLPHFKRLESSHVLFMGSETALQGGIKGAVYSACKAGLRGLAQSLRKEGAKSGVHVGIVNPGMVDSRFHDSANFGPGSDAMEHLKVDDVAEAVLLFLEARPGCVMDEINLSPLKKVLVSKKQTH